MDKLGEIINDLRGDDNFKLGYNVFDNDELSQQYLQQVCQIGCVTCTMELYSLLTPNWHIKTEIRSVGDKPYCAMNFSKPPYEFKPVYSVHPDMAFAITRTVLMAYQQELKYLYFLIFTLMFNKSIPASTTC